MNNAKIKRSAVIKMYKLKNHTQGISPELQKQHKNYFIMLTELTWRTKENQTGKSDHRTSIPLKRIKEEEEKVKFYKNNAILTNIILQNLYPLYIEY